MADLKLQSLRKAFDEAVILHGVDLEVRDGEFMVFVGPSGCGKSTMLRCIAGLEDITSGDRPSAASRWCSRAMPSTLT